MRPWDMHLHLRPLQQPGIGSEVHPGGGPPAQTLPRSLGLAASTAGQDGTPLSPRNQGLMGPQSWRPRPSLGNKSFISYLVDGMCKDPAKQLIATRNYLPLFLFSSDVLNWLFPGYRFLDSFGLFTQKSSKLPPEH